MYSLIKGFITLSILFDAEVKSMTNRKTSN